MTNYTNPGVAFFRDRYSIDANSARRLLDAALAHGGDYAELFFEHRTSGNIMFEQQIVKSANRSINQGVGVRVLLGEAVGYAYTEDLSTDAMLRAADTAAKIASTGAKTPPVDVMHYDTANYYSPTASSIEVPSAEKVAIMRRADAAARAFDTSIQRVDIVMADELK